MKSEKTHGGYRKGAGRKKTEDRKMAVVLYIKQSTIRLLGMEVCQELGKKIIEQQEKKLKKKM